MKAMAIESYGGKEMLKLRELPIPEMSPAEVLIKVEAAVASGTRSCVRASWRR